MKRLSRTLIKNIAANVVRGGATATVALVLPHFLTRLLDADRFAAWSLMLQIVAYASYLDFGLQTAVARYLAQAIERDDEVMRDELVSTVLAMLAGAGLLAALIVGTVAWLLPHLFHGVPLSLMAELRAGILVLGISTCVMLPGSTFTGVLIGLHRNEYPALAIGGTRILGAACVLLTLRHTNSLVWLAFSVSVFNLLGSWIQYVLVRRALPRLKIHIRLVGMRIAQEISRYCSVLVLFSFAMLLISGIDVTIVGYRHYASVGIYSIAATLITFFTGLNGSVVAALVAPAAVLQARGEYGRIRDLILTITALSTYCNLGLTIVAVLAGRGILSAWIGPDYAQQTLPILEVLLLAQSFRMIGAPYSSALMATGLQRRAILPAVVEAVTNVAFSIVGVIWLGPIGVALGTLFSAALAICVYVGRTIDAVEHIPLSRMVFLRQAVGRPVLCLAPMLLYVMLRSTKLYELSPWVVLSRFSLPAAIALTMLLSWRYRTIDRSGYRSS